MELVHFDGVLFHDESLGGSNRAIYQRWDPKKLTSAKNSLPKDMKSEFLHKEKTDPKNKAAKVARFAQLIIAVKKTDSYE
jgi:hypothetical protein